MINETPPPHDVVGTRSDREGISFVAFLVLALQIFYFWELLVILHVETSINPRAGERKA